MNWSLYKEGEFLKPLTFSNGKNQEDVVNEVLEAVKRGKNIIFIHGVCGTGKSGIALNIARSLGKTSIIVPGKNLQEQYKEDYTEKKYLLKEDKQKEKLKALRSTVDILTLTATPIPRTLHMALTGARDMSIITTPPQNRIPIKTEIVEFDEDLIKKAIQRELKRKGQVFFLHNRVEDIEQIARIVNRLSESARIGIAHGQMSPKVLEDIMIKFLDGAIDVLVCTTIIGSGIDIPNANTLIVNRADNFGLADLHQLRGRVGRSDVKSYAYFIVPPKKILSSIAKARLEAIEKFCGLGAGFKIAFEDMQLRGAGNLLGGEQHGYITSIGFDLYCRLLKESVENLKLLNEGTANAANI